MIAKVPKYLLCAAHYLKNEMSSKNKMKVLAMKIFRKLKKIIWKIVFFIPTRIKNNRSYSIINKNYSRHEDAMQALWIGDRLSKIEVLSIKSFLAHGHKYHLYTYEQVKNVPDGVVIKDANEIIPRDKIIKNYAGFSDLFRYKLLFEKGGWWVDMDEICLKHFDFSDYYTFAYIRKDLINGGVIYVNNNHEELFKTLYLRANDLMDEKWDRWDAIGPPLFTECICKYRLLGFAKPSKTFYPIWYMNAKDLFAAQGCIPSQSYGVHIWTSFFGWQKISKESFDKTSIVGQLWEKYAQGTVMLE